jgi:hypothetical protein
MVHHGSYISIGMSFMLYVSRDRNLDPERKNTHRRQDEELLLTYGPLRPTAPRAVIRDVQTLTLSSGPKILTLHRSWFGT